MKRIELTVNSRGATGRGPSRRVRAAGNVPAVVYGKSGVRHLEVAGADWGALWKQTRGSVALIELSGAGVEEPIPALVAEVQRDPCSDAFLHVDFREITRGELLDADISVRLEGVPIGVKMDGAVLEQRAMQVEVRCLPRNLPEFILVNVSQLKTGDSVHVGDLEPIEGVTYLSDREVVIAACAAPKLKAEDEEAEEAAEAEGEAAAEAAPAAEEG